MRGGWPKNRQKDIVCAMASRKLPSKSFKSKKKLDDEE